MIGVVGVAVLALLAGLSGVIPVDLTEILTKAIFYVAAFAAGVGVALLYFLWAIMRT